MLSTLPYHSAVFMSGIFSGAKIAELPSFLNQRILDTLVDGTTLSVSMTSSYSFHVLSGLFQTKVHSPLFEISQLLYCHRTIPNLMVMEIHMKRPSNVAPRVAPTLTLRIQRPKLELNDVNELFLNSDNGQLQNWRGQVKFPEVKQGENGALVSVHFDQVPQVLELKRGLVSQKWIFMASYGHLPKESLEKYQQGQSLKMEGSLLNSHINSWLENWEQGFLQVRGNTTISSAIFSSQYSLLSEIKSSNYDDFSHTTSGLSQCGLACMNMTLCDFGLIGNHQEYAVIPSLVSIQPNLALELLLSRVKHYHIALWNAVHIHHIQSVTQAAAFPWLTSNSGFELYKDSFAAQYQMLPSGLLAYSIELAKKYIFDTKGDSLLKNTFQETAVAIANFYGALLQNDGSIPHVLGPYDQTFIINNSISINLLAELSFKLARNVGNTTNKWENVEKRLKFPKARYVIHLCLICDFN